MLKKVVWMVAAATIVAAPSVFAQEHRGEVGVNLGWTFSDGVDGQGVRALDGNVYDRVDPKDSSKWGLNGGVLRRAERRSRFHLQPAALDSWSWAEPRPAMSAT